MALISWEMQFILDDNEGRIYEKRLLSGDTVASVENWLRREYGAGRVTVVYIEHHSMMNPVQKIARTCGCCGTHMTAEVSLGRRIHPAQLDKSLRYKLH